MNKTISDKLRDVARWIEEGRVVQQRDPNFKGEWKDEWNCPDNSGNVRVSANLEYRAKPIKPRVVSLVGEDHKCFDSIEITKEVREALKQAGIDYE